MPKVSILIPTHNRGGTILPSVESALGQTMHDVEVIVYDDGSDHMDGILVKRGRKIKIGEPTPVALSSVKDKRFKYVKNKKNHGAAFSRNQLLKMATGEYCMWQDSDDVSNKWRVEFCLKAIEQFNAPYARCGVATFTKDPSIWKSVPHLAYQDKVSFATTLFRRVGAIEFDERYVHCCEDMDWELRMASKFGSPVFVPLSLYGIGRRSPDRLTHRFKIEEYAQEYEKDRERYAGKVFAITQKMNDVGKSRSPNVVPWSFIEPFIHNAYDAYYSKQAV